LPNSYKLVGRLRPGLALNEHYVGDGDVVYRQARQLGCEGIVSKRLGSPYRSASTESFARVDGTSFSSCFPAEIVARFHGNGFETPKSPACEASSLCRNADRVPALRTKETVR
jgi:ATP-dependent DNA ligase